MAFTSPFPHQVSDLTLAKPSLFWLPLSSPVAHALKALKHREEPELSVWICSCASHERLLRGWIHVGFIHGAPENQTGTCQCVGKVCMQKIICYLCTDESLKDLPKALSQPLSVLFTDPSSVVNHISSNTSIPEALSLIVNGVQNLVVPVERPFMKFRAEIGKKMQQKSKSAGDVSSFPTSHNGLEYCWLTHEDVMRFLVGFVGLFSPLPMMSIQELGVINTDVLMVEADKDAISALDMIIEASRTMSAVAVVENTSGTGPKLVGDISSFTLQDCDETAALALATLTARDFLSYAQGCRNPSAALVQKVRSKIVERLDLLKGNLSGTVLKRQPVMQLCSFYNQEMEASGSSSDEEPEESPTSHHQHISWRWLSIPRLTSLLSFRGRMRLSPIVCRPGSSLMAVLLQALAHRENYVWVTDEDRTLLGIVTFTDIAGLFSEHLNGRKILL